MADKDKVDEEASNTTSSTDEDIQKLYVGNIPVDCTAKQLEELFSKHGTVKKADIVKNFAFVFIHGKKSAEDALAALHNTTFNGKQLTVQISRNKMNLPEAQNACFECGKDGHWARDCPNRRGSRNRSPHRGGDRYGGRGSPPPRERGMAHAFDRRSRDPYGRDPYGRDPYGRDLYSRDLYARDLYGRDLYGRDLYGRDPYGRDAYGRDSYSRDPYGQDLYAREAYLRAQYAREQYAAERAAYVARERSPVGRSTYDIDPYAAERERIAYGRGLAAASAASAVSAQRVDPYASAAASYGTSGAYAALSASRYVDPQDAYAIARGYSAAATAIQQRPAY